MRSIKRSQQKIEAIKMMMQTFVEGFYFKILDIYKNCCRILVREFNYYDRFVFVLTPQILLPKCYKRLFGFYLGFRCFPQACSITYQYFLPTCVTIILR